MLPGATRSLLIHADGLIEYSPLVLDTGELRRFFLDNEYIAEVGIISDSMERIDYYSADDFLSTSEMSKFQRKWLNARH